MPARPTDRDIIYACHASIGISQTSVEFWGRRYRVFDVGGRRFQRQKWVHALEEADAAIFVVSLIGYGERTIESEDTVCRKQVEWSCSIYSTSGCRRCIFVFIMIEVD